MANTTFQLKRSSVAGKQPNTSTIVTGELALNLTDQKLYSSNGTGIFEPAGNVSSLYVGNSSVYATVNSTFFSGLSNTSLNSNNSTYLNAQPASYYTNANNITSGVLPYAQIPTNVINTTASYTISGSHTYSNNISLNNNVQFKFNTVNTSAYATFVQQTDDNFVFYSTNTAYGARPVFGVYANSITSNLQVYIPLQLNSGLVANGGLGSAGQVLFSNGSATYWATAAGSGTVTSVASGNGITGGPITSTGTLSILANTGIVANTSGLFVHSSYINTSSNYTITGVHTYNANVIMGTSAGISANGSIGSAGQFLTSNGTSVYWSTVANTLPGGSNTQVQFNNSGAFGGSSLLTFNSSTGVLNPSYLSVGTGAFATRRANFANGELTFIPYSAAEGATTNTYFMNLCDSGGNNGASMTLYIRGLATGGSTDATLAGVTVKASALNVTGDVVSNYSDIRLKHVSGPVLNALEKVSKIETFYYTPNKMALAIGADNAMKQRIGVSAQKMQEILPEVVHDSPLGQGYLTVQYERIVPLLIEAIKELKEEIRVLKETK